MEIKLSFIQPESYKKVWNSNTGSIYDKVAAIAAFTRLNTLSMIMEAGSGHIGSSFSSIEIISWIHCHYLQAFENAHKSLNGVYFSSKGHDAPALYALLIGLGRLEKKLIHQLRRINGLPGHPDINTPEIITNTGSLGMGISKAKGMTEANKLNGKTEHIFVLLGDGELQEGQIWESLQGAANRKLGNITAIIDHNKIQSDTWVKNVSDLGNLEAKFKAFGWIVERCDGHNIQEIAQKLATLTKQTNTPGVLIADTKKAHGVSFMEQFPENGEFFKYHSGAPSVEEYNAALLELKKTCEQTAQIIGIAIKWEESIKEISTAPKPKCFLVDAWSEALCALATNDQNIIALDGDLKKDTGLVEFSKRFPDRYIECGIAEQDMVSMAGGLALKGKLPVVHSFSCFLSGRPHEQAINNSTEKTKIVYAGSLAGLIPGGPGHSHQCVTDLTSFSSLFNALMVEPAHASEVKPLLELAIKKHNGPIYYRITTPGVEFPFAWPDSELKFGEGTVVQKGSELTIVTSGPVLLKEAYLAVQKVNAKITLISLPWLNYIDTQWWAKVLSMSPRILVIENHRVGALGNYLLSKTNKTQWKGTFKNIGVTEIPACGLNDEVLDYHKLNASGIEQKITSFLSK